MTPDHLRDDEAPDWREAEQERFDEWRAQASDDELADYYRGKRWKR